MDTGFKRVMVWLLVLLLGFLAACDGEPEDPAVSPLSTPPPTTSAESTETADTAMLSQAGRVPTYINLSQFPVAIIDYASAQRPAFATVEMAGFNISQLSWQIGRDEDNCRRLVAMDLISPNITEAESGLWQDGVHRANFSWSAVGHFLSDDEQGDFVFIQVTDRGGMISGRYRSAVSGEVVGANLLVDQTGSRVIGIQTLTGESLTAVAGDGFQLFSQCLEQDGSIRSMAGAELFFLEGGQLNLEKRPTNSGDYFLQLTASGPENSVSSITNFPVENESLVPDYQVYLDTTYGFQFLYPADWQLPQSQNDRIVTDDGAGATSLTITTHPALAGRTPSDLKNQALAQFGNVPVLFEDQVSIGDTGALWTAYGYSGNNGSHTGVLLAFIRDSVGYLIDMDGLETAESQTISLTNTLAETWLFRPDITAPRAMEWTVASFDGLAMPVMTNYYQEVLDNGWQRFTVGDGISFLSVRSESLGRDDLDDRLDHWQEVAERGVTDFAVSDRYAFTLDEREWTRMDFAYAGPGGSTIQGFFMAAEINEKAVVFWIETPATRYEEQSAVFLLSLAGLR